jgi:hypothetical protein
MTNLTLFMALKLKIFKLTPKLVTKSLMLNGLENHQENGERTRIQTVLNMRCMLPCIHPDIEELSSNKQAIQQNDAKHWMSAMKEEIASLINGTWGLNLSQGRSVIKSRLIDDRLICSYNKLKIESPSTLISKLLLVQQPCSSICKFHAFIHESFSSFTSPTTFESNSRDSIWRIVIQGTSPLIHTAT